MDSGCLVTVSRQFAKTQKIKERVNRVNRLLTLAMVLFHIGENHAARNEAGKRDIVPQKSDILATACARIGDLAEPAFIKDGELRYVAVNEAYARLFGTVPAALVGQASRTLGEGETGERKDKECRALVFGEDQTAFSYEADGRLANEIRIEPFLSENEQCYLFGTVHAVGETGQVERNILGAASAVFDKGALDDALDMLEMGIGIYDHDNVLTYCNAQFINYLNVFGIDVEPGMSVEEIGRRGYEFHRRNDPSSTIGIEQWLGEKTAGFFVAYHDSADMLPDGRWIRSVNKRLENGLLVAIRYDITEFKEQEAQLRSHAGESVVLRAVLEDLPVPVFVRGSDFRLTYANAAYERMLGKSREVFLGTTEYDMFPAAADRFRRENLRVLSGEDIDKNEEITFPDGSVVPVITRLRRVNTPDGGTYMVGSRTDVSLIKEAKDKAEKLHDELKLILDAMPVGVAILDERFDFEFANGAFYEFWDAEERFDLSGRSYREFLAADFEYGNASAWHSFDAFYRARIEALSVDGETVPIEVESTKGRMLAISGTKLGGGKTLLTYVDVTAVRKHEEEAQEAKAALVTHGALMRDATSAMSQGLLILRDGEIIFGNDALPKMLEIPCELLTPGRPWREMFRFCVARGDFGDTVAAGRALRSWDENVQAGRQVVADFEIEGRRWIRAEANMTGSDHWLAVFTDITESKQRESELTQLVQRAEAADRAKSEFLANMSHEIRTPMNGVLGMAELLSKSHLDTRQKTFIDIIVKSGNALLTIINDILDFSKIDAGQMKLRKAPFDPVEAIEDVATLLSSAAADKDIELIVRGDVAVRETVLGDAGRFRQIVTNLVGNAVKFTEKGHVFIDLKSRPMAGDQMMLSVRIEDTGLGIPKDKLASVFDKFSQVDASSTRRHEGTGLGLAITAGLVNLFGGSVEVESELGIGSAFTVNLPFVVVSERGQVTTLPVNTSGARVLVVDDNAVNRRILTEQLGMCGFDTVAAENGSEGLAILKEAARIGVTVDAIVLDYHMPQMNGLDFAEALRADRRFDGTGVIFLTSMDMASDDTTFARLDIHAHLMKPARANLLRSTVIDVVRSVRTSRRALQSALPAMSDSSGSVRDEGRKTVGGVAVEEMPTTPAIAATPGLDVLVAEDNEVNQIVFTQILQTTNWLFQIVRNGAEAVEAWQKHDPAVILMDVSMPVMNGHQATRKIRDLEAATGAHVPIIGVTAHALESDRELCFQAGMDDYLSKPISPEALEAKIRNWIGGAVIASTYE